MRCPYCPGQEDKVIDSRVGREGEVVRRRRECLQCGRRFTTYERVEESLPMVVKKDGRRETFDPRKVGEGLKRACQKRPVATDDVEAIVTGIERQLQESGEKEVESSVIGEKVMDALRELDDVAYVRFASVYRSFRDLNEFMEELRSILGQRGTGPGAAERKGGPETR